MGLCSVIQVMSVHGHRATATCNMITDYPKNDTFLPMKCIRWYV